MSRMNRKERNNFLMRVGAVLIAVCMVAALALPAFAADTSAENEPYKYTVRIFPGDKGTINGSTDPIVKEVETFLQDIHADISVAVMGCPVNGIQEASRADVGIAGGYDSGILFRHGERVRTVPQDELLDALKAEILRMVNEAG